MGGCCTIAMGTCSSSSDGAATSTPTSAPPPPTPSTKRYGWHELADLGVQSISETEMLIAGVDEQEAGVEPPPPPTVTPRPAKVTHGRRGS